MRIEKIKITNFKCFRSEFCLSFNKGVNIIAGDNESGKSTILEALHLALTGYIQGKPIGIALSQYMFNGESVREYLLSINTDTPLPPPEILIEVYFAQSSEDEQSDYELFKGDGNHSRESASGICFRTMFSEKYRDEYNAIIKTKQLNSLPIEYYAIALMSFARKDITARSIPIKTSLIDSSNYNYQNGSDLYVSRIIRNSLDTDDIVGVAQAYRRMLETFSGDEVIEQVNSKLDSGESLTKRKVQLSVDLGTKSAWESSLIVKIDEIPFHHVGKGTQCIVKTELALVTRQAQKAPIILIEEPESHLAFANLNSFINAMSLKLQGRQIIMTTHSSFVANKLGLDNLILLNNLKTLRLKDISSDTKAFFQKLQGYDTLRFLLCKKAILCEGDSDELIIQKAYMLNHDGRLPIEDGIDVISVRLSFLRYLELAEMLQKPTVVVTDNDGDVVALEEKYKGYIGKDEREYIRICYDSVVDVGSLKIGNSAYNYNTLEPKMLKSNGLVAINAIFETAYSDEDSLRVYMKQHKTDCALAVFFTSEKIVFPGYIVEAIK